jgi:Uma2 family endonuclease
MVTQTQATIEDVLRLGAQGERYELVDGVLAPMSLTNPEHGAVETSVGSRLQDHVAPRRLGRVLSGEVLFSLDSDGRQGRAPDVAFVSRERWLNRQINQGAFVGPPDLAVEVVSPNDSAKDLQKRVDDWLDYGTLAVLLLFGDEQRAVLWTKAGATSLRTDDELSLDPAVPGFHCKVSELFPTPLD